MATVIDSQMMCNAGMTNVKTGFFTDDPQVAGSQYYPRLASIRANYWSCRNHSGGELICKLQDKLPTIRSSLEVEQTLIISVALVISVVLFWLGRYFFLFPPFVVLVSLIGTFAMIRADSDSVSVVNGAHHRYWFRGG